mgnify:CR=1 FL=1
MTKFIFVAGGVISGVGKGVACASIGKILQSKGFKVSAAKIDPYVNVDAGTLNPLEHGEVFVTLDGTECDQDVGNYERFLDQNFASVNYLTTGRVYQTVINRERNLGYNGKTVEVFLHIPEEVIARLQAAAEADKADFLLVEVGGTVGDYQNVLFLEAGRMMKRRMPDQVMFVLVTYLPIPENVGEMKTKPTQHAVRALNAAGIQPDIIIARAKVPVDAPRKQKISDFCNVDVSDVISAPDVESIYEIPLNFESDNLGNRILEKFGLAPIEKDLKDWQKLVRTIKAEKKPVNIGIVGKYFEIGDFTLMDSYISVIESIKHASWANNRDPKITWLSAEKYQDNSQTTEELKEYDGIIVPGGFGSRGTEGKIKAIQFCRENSIPYFGLCLGLQLAVIEFARNVCGLKDATSTEFVKDAKTPVIDVMPDQKALLEEKRYGATMRLGSYPCKLKKGTIAHKAYGVEDIAERHRHRYELNNKYLKVLESKGLVMSGINTERDLVEIAELKNGSTGSPQGHPFFLGTQFHPEFQSRPLHPHPLFLQFLKACAKD